jgi:hypothetical protein
MPPHYGKGQAAQYHGLKNIKAILGGFSKGRHTQSHKAKERVMTKCSLNGTRTY